MLFKITLKRLHESDNGPQSIFYMLKEQQIIGKVKKY